MTHQKHLNSITLKRPGPGSMMWNKISRWMHGNEWPAHYFKCLLLRSTLETYRFGTLWAISFLFLRERPNNRYCRTVYINANVMNMGVNYSPHWSECTSIDRHADNLFMSLCYSRLRTIVTENILPLVPWPHNSMKGFFNLRCQLSS